MIHLVKLLRHTGNAIPAFLRLQFNLTPMSGLPLYGIRLILQRTIFESACRFATFRPRPLQRRIDRSRLSRLSTEFESQPQANETISLAAQLFVSESQCATNDEAVIKKIDESPSTASRQEIDSMFKRLDELAAVKIRLADKSIEVSDGLEFSDESDVDSDSEGFLEGESSGPRTFVGTAGPVRRVLELYGSPDPAIPMSRVPCHGCGALLHCRDTGIPGYVPSQRFLATPSSELKDVSCQRCHLLNEFNIAIDATVGPKEYEAITSEIRKAVALVVILIDLTDLPGSFYRGIAQVVGRGRPVYIIGNKVDLLPKDDEGYLQRIKQSLVTLCEKYGMTGSHVKHIALISAKTGYGVEQLITKLLDDWRLKGQVYILGCTNAGKSTLFNALLSSDFCRIAARDIIRRATTSIWPGTTLNLLKFPIVNPKPARLFERTQRLLAEKSQHAEEENLRRKALKETGNLQYASLMGHIGQTSPTLHQQALERKLSESSGFILPSYTFRDPGGQSPEHSAEEEEDGSSLQEHAGRAELMGRLKVKVEKYSDASFKYWCYDTPGLVNPDQIINVLTAEELMVVLPMQQIVPRTFSIRPTQVMFVSGLGRIDYLEGDKHIYCTVFTASGVPVHVQEQHEAEDFYRRSLGQPTLGVPLGDVERLSRIPALVGSELKLEGLGFKEAAADVVLSSIGWVSITAPEGQAVTLRTFTPGGLGCSLRVPALLPFAVNLRGKRIRGSYTYHTRTPKF